MRRQTVHAIFFSLFFLLAAPVAPFAEEQKAPSAPERTKFQSINLDQVIANTRRDDGQRLILRPARPVKLDIEIMRLPETRKLEYIYTALRVGGGLDPLPEVSHRMFVKTRGGVIIPVYVEDMAALKIKDRLKVGQKVRFNAFHVYNYSKGPAFLVVGFEKEPGT